MIASVSRLKAVGNLDNAHIAQTFGYLEAFNKEVGMPLNFGAPKLQYHRLTNKQFVP